METVTRTVRFKRSDVERIERFLANNPIFDFSSLVRQSVEAFIRQPKLALKPVKDRETERRVGRDQNV